MRATLEDWGLFALRVGAGITFLYHGYLKLFVGLGPLAFSRYLHAQHFPAPLFFAWVFALLEFFGGLALIAGIQPKYAAEALAVERIITAVGLKMVRGVGFSPVRGIGWEFDFLLLCMTVAIAVLGAGAVTLQVLVPMVRSRRMA
jgi:uncharacterized membrane protein YphA (DoxX/SURF4 family)